MKKKETIKEQRAKAQIQRQKSFKAVDEKRKQQEECVHQENEKHKDLEIYQKKLAEIRKVSDSISGRKRIAKAAGLKSTFTICKGELMMTSFGRGSEAIPEKRIVGDDVKSIAEKEALAVTVDKDTFHVAGRVLQEKATVDDPRHAGKESGEDMIHCRSALEKLYFGKTFEDNIHIQLIYNILDIEKILCVHVNNIVFEINNMLRSEDDEHGDLIGSMGIDRSNQTYEKFSHPEKNKEKGLLEQFNQLMNQRQMGYFGEEFALILEKNQKKRENKKRDIYHLLSVLGTVRQATAHGEASTRAMLFQIESTFDKPKENGCRKEARAALDELYAKRVFELNADFLKHANNDLILLFRALHVSEEKEKKEYACAYYDFVVRKQYKNIGFSIKKLRESILANEEDALPLTDQRFDTVRSKLYRAIDFVIYRYCTSQPEWITNMVDILRASLSEDEKEEIYRVKAKEVWFALRDVILNHIAPQMDGKIIAAITEKAVQTDAIDKVLIPPHAHAFSEMIYLLTFFLDGKEINDLLTQLINKFDNIAAFLSVLKSENLQTAFAPDYALLSESRVLSQELRIINSFARMTSPDDIPTKEVMFVEAAEILGYEKSEDELKVYIHNMLSKENGVVKANGKKDNGFRNFIINNVIKSDRFRYLVRYGNPKKLRAWAENEKVVSFVLAGIPDAQILRYYNSCIMPPDRAFPVFDAAMRGALTKMIAGISFMGFADVHQGNGGTREQAQDKVRKQASIRLYLTVLYLLQKNLVYVNSRYFLAFHCAERDGLLYNEKEFGKKVIKSDRAAFAKAFLEKYPPKKRVKEYLQKNMENANRWSLNEFRNCTEHLGALRNADNYIADIASFDSYFELYHYLVQRYLKDQFDHFRVTPSKQKETLGQPVITDEAAAEGRLQQYFALVLQYHTYCKDFVKALTVPFAYNLPRYKNLSINELFDRNHYLPKQAEKNGLCFEDETDAQ